MYNPPKHAVAYNANKPVITTKNPQVDVVVDPTLPAPMLTRTTASGIKLTLQSATCNHAQLWKMLTSIKTKDRFTAESIREIFGRVTTDNPICSTVAHYGRVCTTRDNKETCLDEDLNTCKRFIKDGHYTPFESVSFDVLIENISRVCLAQLTRYRRVGFNVESQKYNKYNNGVSIHLPAEMCPKVNIRNKYKVGKKTIDISLAEFFDLITAMYTANPHELKTDTLRYILANATSVRLRMTFNLREFFFIYKERTGNRASAEIHEMVDGLFSLIHDSVDVTSGKLLDFYKEYNAVNFAAFVGTVAYFANATSLPPARKLKGIKQAAEQMAPFI